MALNIHVHIHDHRMDKETISEILINQNNKLNKIMAKQEDFDAVLTRIDAATTDIADDLKGLRDEIKNAGLPSDVEDSVLSKLTAAADKLEGIAADPQDPIPTEPTEPEQPTEPGL